MRTYRIMLVYLYKLDLSIIVIVFQVASATAEMAYRKNMLCFQLLISALALSDCSLTPIIRPLLKSIDGKIGLTSNHSPVYRIQGSNHRLTPFLRMNSNDRWGIDNTDSTGSEVISPLPLSLTKITATGNDDMYKYLIKPTYRIKLSRMPQIDGYINANRPKVIITGRKAPVINLNSYIKPGIKRSWFSKYGSGDVGAVNNRIVLKPWSGRGETVWKTSNRDSGEWSDVDDNSDAPQVYFSNDIWMSKSGDDFTGDQPDSDNVVKFNVKPRMIGGDKQHQLKPKYQFHANLRTGDKPQRQTIAGKHIPCRDCHNRQ